MAAIGARSRTVRFSGETAAKQRGTRITSDGRRIRGHPDVQPQDYALVQRILDEGEVFASAPRRAMGFLEVDGKLWRAVVKASRDRSKTSLATLRRAQPDDLDRARRRLKGIDRDGEG